MSAAAISAASVAASQRRSTTGKPSSCKKRSQMIFKWRGRRATADVLQRRPQRLQSAQGAGRADPNQVYALGDRLRLFHGVHGRIDAGGDDMHAGGSGPAGGVDGEEIVAGDDGVAGPNRGGEAVEAAGALEAAGSVGVAQENGVVQVEQQQAGRLAQTVRVPTRAAVGTAAARRRRANGGTATTRPPAARESRPVPASNRRTPGRSGTLPAGSGSRRDRDDRPAR